MLIYLVLWGSLPLKRGRQLFAVAPPMAQHWAVHPSLCQGGGDLGNSLQWLAVAVVHCCCCLYCVAVSHRRRCCPQSFSVTIGHHSCHLWWPSLLSPLAIAKSCCLGTARNLFKQFKQRMLTLFYFV